MILKSTRGHLLAFVMFKSYTKPKKSNQIKQQVHAHSLNTKRGYYIIMSCHTTILQQTEPPTPKQNNTYALY
jgi:hypothetical protein